MQTALEIRNLSKRYGRRVALDGLNIAVPSGAVAAFVGANGAGKTTTFSLIGSFQKPDAGEVHVCGRPLKHYRLEGGVLGLLPQDALFSETRTLERQLLLTARLSGLSGRDAWAEVNRVLELVKLADRNLSLSEELSHGMKVRLGMAQALVGNPPLILLDEPTAGLDPRMLASFRETVKQVQGSTTIVISSHDLGQLEQICDYLCIIDQGKLVRQGPLARILAESSAVKYRLDHERLDLAALKAAVPMFSYEQPERGVLVANFDAQKFTVPQVNSLILAHLGATGIGVLEIESRRSLEQSYFEHTR